MGIAIFTWFLRFCFGCLRIWFRLDSRISSAAMPVASTTTAPARHAVAQAIFAAFNPQHFPVNQRVGEFLSCGIIDALNRRTGNVHMLRALFLRISFRIDQANCLILVDRHLHNAVVRICSIQRAVSIVFRKAANSSPFKGSRHSTHLVYLRRPQVTLAASAIVHRFFS